jgi:hypothetical protein
MKHFFLGYIDPGLGALIWQSIVAAFVGLFFYLKKTRQWFVGVFRKILGRRRNPPATPIAAKFPAAKIEAKTEAR